MGFPTKLSQLCLPSRIYFSISIIFYILSIIQNIGNKHTYAIGMYSCKVPSCIFVFFLKLVYILFWTWILNLMCKDGHSNIAWLLVLFPFVLFFVLVGLMIVYDNKSRKK